jgi:hypothetical protein
MNAIVRFFKGIIGPAAVMVAEIKEAGATASLSLFGTCPLLNREGG